MYIRSLALFQTVSVGSNADIFTVSSLNRVTAIHRSNHECSCLGGFICRNGTFCNLDSNRVACYVKSLQSTVESYVLCLINNQVLACPIARSSRNLYITVSARSRRSDRIIALLRERDLQFVLSKSPFEDIITGCVSLESHVVIIIAGNNSAGCIATEFTTVRTPFATIQYNLEALIAGRECDSSRSSGLVFGQGHVNTFTPLPVDTANFSSRIDFCLAFPLCTRVNFLAFRIESNRYIIDAIFSDGQNVVLRRIIRVVPTTVEVNLDLYITLFKGNTGFLKYVHAVLQLHRRSNGKIP